MSTEAETRQAILRNARAQERDRLRNLARTHRPDLDGDALEAKVRELEVEKLSAAGRAGRATQHKQARVGRRYTALRPELETRIEAILRLIRDISDDPDDRDAA